MKILKVRNPIVAGDLVNINNSANNKRLELRKEIERIGKSIQEKHDRINYLIEEQKKEKDNEFAYYNMVREKQYLKTFIERLERNKKALEKQLKTVISNYEIDLNKYKKDPSIIAVYSTKKVGGVEAYVIRKTKGGYRWIGKLDAGSTTDFKRVKDTVNSTRNSKKQLTLIYGTDVNDYRGVNK